MGTQTVIRSPVYSPLEGATETLPAALRTERERAQQGWPRLPNTTHNQRSPTDAGSAGRTNSNCVGKDAGRGVGSPWRGCHCSGRRPV